MKRQTSKVIVFVIIFLILGACGVGTIGDFNDPAGKDDRVLGTDAAIPSTPDDQGPSLPEPKSEKCNGYDDDQNGQVDENCNCANGASQACHPWPEVPLKGICQKGTQNCNGDGEFGTWGPCIGAILPQSEICGDGIDQDCDGADMPCPPPVCGDGSCNGTEDCLTCPGDCGSCPSICENFTFAVNARAVDIVWIIDQSGSMNSEIAMVKQNMNAFANYISGTQIDYHVIVLAQKGTGTYDICIPPPLGGTNCNDGPRFKQVDVNVQSTNGLSLTKQHISSIESFMRSGSMRHFVIVTDDNSQISASDFDNFLKSRPGYNDYVFHSIIGLKKESCVASVGTVYMDLSNMTKGLQFNICSANWTTLFNTLGQGVANVAVTQYKLQYSPLLGTVSVKYNNQTAQQGIDWDLDTANQQIVLKGTMPSSGTTIKVCYQYKP